MPFTTGILIGIGETRAERIESLLALRDLHDTLRPYPGNHRPEFPAEARHADGAGARGFDVEDHLWTIAMARLMFAPEMNIQAPPNLSPARSSRLVDAGINDWGGVSPVTPDHVNPEAPWPHLDGCSKPRPRTPARS